MTYENLLFEKKDGIAFITFNRPKVLNALNRQTIEEFRHVLLDAKSDRGVGILRVDGVIGRRCGTRDERHREHSGCQSDFHNRLSLSEMGEGEEGPIHMRRIVLSRSTK